LKKNRISKSWLIEQRRDYFVRQSKIQGYRSRSAFKLIDMNKKFNFIKSNTYLLDLGSTPGGWTQVAAKIITKGKILAVDVKQMEKQENATFLFGDINDSKIQEKIVRYFDRKIDVVISDMASNTSGNKNLDSYRTGELCLNAIAFAKKILIQDGVFLSKLFMGSIFQEIKKKAEKCFKKVVIYKPLSSKKESKEIYIYCKYIL
jgi:23S rRNA (uridine2552-2'-O)-methyltransferase